MSAIILAVIMIILCLIIKLLNISAPTECPNLFGRDEKFIETLVKNCPSIHEKYNPTWLWGKSGHVQTLIHGLIGRVHCPLPSGERRSLPLGDGSTLTYDLYEALLPHDDGLDVTLVLSPGIGNSSESIYIRAFIDNARKHGYRCVVMNHLGALKTVKLTASRIFTYGGTEDFSEMMNQITNDFPGTNFILVGFSMGANIVTKYLGEKHLKPSRILGGISICQGYDALRGSKFLLEWENLRRVYLYALTENMKSVIMRNQSMLFSEDVKKKYDLNERLILSAPSLHELDECYTRKVHGYSSTSEFYQKESCVNYMHNINVPIILLNAKDDPLTPQPLLDIAHNFADKHDKAVFIELCHGGHLGFFEGGLLYPNPITWLDRFVIEMANALTKVQ